jgi:hypothetical protein
MIRLLINALVAGNFKSCQDGVKGQEPSMQPSRVGKASVKQVG